MGSDQTNRNRSACQSHIWALVPLLLSSHHMIVFHRSVHFLMYMKSSLDKNIATGETSQVITSRHFSSLLFTSMSILTSLVLINWKANKIQIYNSSFPFNSLHFHYQLKGKHVDKIYYLCILNLFCVFLFQKSIFLTNLMSNISWHNIFVFHPSWCHLH